MKKYIKILLFSCLLIVTLTGCGTTIDPLSNGNTVKVGLEEYGFTYIGSLTDDGSNTMALYVDDNTTIVYLVVSCTLNNSTVPYVNSKGHYLSYDKENNTFIDVETQEVDTTIKVYYY